MQADIYIQAPKIIPVKFRTLSIGYGKKDYQKFPRGLTFYKDFTQGHDLNADYSRGSGFPIFTNTSSNTPVFDSNGISLGTARDDVLKYAILGNRTAAEETIIIKFTPDTDFANDGVYRTLTATDDKSRTIRKSNAVINTQFAPNITDSSGSVASADLSILANVSYVLCGTCQGSTSPYVILYKNGISGATDTDNYTIPVWGTSFYIGSGSAGSLQANCSVSSVAFFGRALSSAEVVTASNLMP